MELLKDDKLFWEADLSTLNAEKHKQYIIERVFERGHWNQLKEVMHYYPLEEVKQALKKARWFDEKTMHFISVYFDIPLQEMRCYTQRQLSPAPWV